MNDKSKLTRRGFLTSTAAAMLAASALPGCGKKSTQSGAPTASSLRVPVARTGDGAGKSKVILIRDAKVMDDNRAVDAAVMASMLDQAVAALVGESDPAKAWARLIKPTDTVGVKTNEWRFLRTPLELEAAIRKRVEGAGVTSERISIRDRGVLSDPIFQRATALINARPMRTHHWSGVGTCIKNYILFHPAPAEWHEDSCANLGGIWKLPIVEGKTRLNILVMMSPLFHGKGPHHFHAEYTWNYKGLIVGFDPVAVDSTGLRILEAKRRAHFGKEEPFATPVTHLRVADKKYQLGNSDSSRIEVVKLGWQHEMLI
ncbi:MAG: DUF362 domain-containing protein [Deltaproteobacteria bacterium]|nr:DUF362 domain-containing protein [Deltaproteobacteria bacterium]